jgi:hypothetical protein
MAITNVTTAFVPLFMLAPIGLAVIGADSPLVQAMLATIIVIAWTGPAMPTSNMAGVMLHSQVNLFTSGKVIKYAFIMSMIVVITQFIGLLVTQGMW